MNGLFRPGHAHCPRHDRAIAFFEEGNILELELYGKSCTGWTVRDAITSANSGLPTMAIATANFETFATEIAARGGRSGLRIHVLPYPLNERFREDVIAIGEAHFHRMIETMGASFEIKEEAA